MTKKFLLKICAYVSAASLAVFSSAPAAFAEALGADITVGAVAANDTAVTGTENKVQGCDDTAVLNETSIATTIKVDRYYHIWNNDIPEGGKYARLAATVTNDPTDASCTYQWYKAAGTYATAPSVYSSYNNAGIMNTAAAPADSAYQPIAGATDAAYVLENNDSYSWLKLKVTAAKDGYATTETWSEAQPVTILGDTSSWTTQGKVWYGIVWGVSRPATAKTSGDNEFYVNGKKYTVLNEYTGDTSSYYVLCDFLTETAVAFDTSNAVSYATGSSTNIGYRINQSGYAATNLGSEIASHIDYAHVWHTEACDHTTTAGAQFWPTYDKAGLGLLSISEYDKFAEKIGVDEATGSTSNLWWLRSCEAAYGIQGSAFFAGNTSVMGYRAYSERKYNTATGNPWSLKSTLGVRPSFYLNSDFFTGVHLDVTTVGINVKKMIASRYTREQLKSLYTDDELNELLNTLKNVSDLKSTINEDKTVTVSWTDPSDAEITGVRIYFIDTDGNENELGTFDTSVTSYIATESGTYRVKTTDAAGNTSSGKDITIRLPGEGPPEITVTVTETAATAMTNEILSATVANTGVSAAYTYQWSSCDTQTGTYTKVYSGNESTYTTENNDCQMYFKVTVTATAAGYDPVTADSDVVYVNQMGYSDGNPGAVSAAGLNAAGITTGKKKAGSDNTFRISGEKDKQYVMLNQYTSDTSAFYILADNFYGTYAYDSDAHADSRGVYEYGMKFTLKDSVGYDENRSNIAFYLQSDTFKAQLSTSITPYIDYNHIWCTERGSWDTTQTAPQTKEAMGIGLLSVSEFLKYYAKAGYTASSNVGASSAAYWLTRSQQSSWVGTGTCLGINASSGDIEGLVSSSEYMVRPSFYLSKDFFLNVKLDVSTMGNAVKSALLGRYTEEELLKIYSAAEIDEMKQVPPTISAISVSGDARVNGTLTGAYVYDHMMDISEGESTYGFEISDTSDGDYKSVSTGKTWTVTAAALGRYVKFWCQPQTSTGVQGTLYASDPVKIYSTANTNVTDVTFTNGSGKKISTIKGQTDLTPVVTISNPTASAKTVCIMTVLYDQANNVLASSVVSKSITAGATSVISEAALALPAYQSGSYAKVLVWDDLYDIDPELTTNAIIK